MRILNGAHLTATDRQALAFIRENETDKAHSARIDYELAPAAEHAGAHWFTIKKREHDDHGRPQVRTRRALLQLN